MEVLMTLLKLVIMIVVPVLTSVLTVLARKYIFMAIDKYTKGEVADNLKAGTDIILDSVDYVQQTYVDTLKQSNQFTLEAQTIASQKAKERAIELMNTDIQKSITDNYCNLDKYVETVIESAIAKRHR